MNNWNELTAYEGYFQYLSANQNQIKINEFNLDKNISENVPTGILNSGTVIVDELVKHNKARTVKMIQDGVDDDSLLLEVLSNWKSFCDEGKKIPITFLGLRITTDCNLHGADRCRYCNQHRYCGALNIERTIEAAKEISECGKIRGIRTVISGGEPFIIGMEELFSKEGLVTTLNEMGFIVSMNSNLHLLSPLMVAPIINSGLANFHTSFDTIDELVHDASIYDGACRRVYTSLYMFQKVKQILKVKYPLLHINVVATKDNLLQFDKLFEELLKIRGDYYTDKEGNPIVNPDLSALSPHLITVGGEANKDKRPSKEQWHEFVERVLPICRNMWDEYLDRNQINKTMHNRFEIVHSNANPFFSSIFERSIDYDKKINELILSNSRGDNNQCKKCYLAATQGYICPNGDVFSCGIHADAPNSKVLGNINEQALEDIIRSNIDYINNELPDSDLCKRCTRSIRNTNAIIEERLKIFIKKWKKEYQGKEVGRDAVYKE